MDLRKNNAETILQFPVLYSNENIMHPLTVKRGAFISKYRLSSIKNTLLSMGQKSVFSMISVSGWKG